MDDMKKTRKLSAIQIMEIPCPACGEHTKSIKYKSSDSGVFYRILCRCGLIKDMSVDEYERTINGKKS